MIPLLQSLIGTPITEESIKSLRAHGGSIVDQDDEILTIIRFDSLGVELKGVEIYESVSLVCPMQPTDHGYNGSLPHGLGWFDDRETVRKVCGEPFLETEGWCITEHAYWSGVDRYREGASDLLLSYSPDETLIGVSWILPLKPKKW